MPGPPLSVRGRDESRRAGIFLVDMGLQHLFVSPFTRTIQTADEINSSLHIPSTITKLIQEVDPHESLAQVRVRTDEFLRYLLESSHTRVGVVTHGSPIGEMLQSLSKNQIDLSKHMYDPSRNPSPTAGIWHAHFDGCVWHCSLVFRP